MSITRTNTRRIPLTRTQAAQALRAGMSLKTADFSVADLNAVCYTFHVVLRYNADGVTSILSYHPNVSKLHLNPRQVLSFIRRNYPRKAS